MTAQAAAAAALKLMLSNKDTILSCTGAPAGLPAWLVSME